MCVCVCKCGRERGRERESERLEGALRRAAEGAVRARALWEHLKVTTHVKLC